MRSTTVEHRGVAVVVSEFGRSDAPPVLVLHGFGGAAAAMESLTGALARTRLVLAPDLVGHGRSDAPEDVDQYRAEALVDQLDAVTRGVEGGVDVVGYSMGARAALTFAASRPGAVRRLVLISGTAGIEDCGDRAPRRAADEALARELEHDGVEAFAERWEALSMWDTFRGLGTAAVATSRRVRREQRATGLANSLRGFGATAMPSLWSALPATTLPTLLVAGGLDAKYREIATAMVAALPEGHVAVVPDAGHAVHLEMPEAVAALCVSHLGG